MTDTAGTQPYIPVRTEGNERLEQLTAQWHEAKSAADAANERLGAIKAAIKSELAAMTNSYPRVALTSPHLDRPLKLLYVERWEVDSKRLKVEAPMLYAQYAVKKGRWELREGGAAQ